MRPPLLALALLAASGCTSTRTLTSDPAGYARANRALGAHVATVTFVDGRTAFARAVRLAPDTTTWIVPATGALARVPTADLLAVRRVDRERGAEQGRTGAGVGVGVAVGVAAFATLRSSDCTSTLASSCSPLSQAAMATGAGALTGSLASALGWVIGEAIGERVEVRLPASSGRAASVAPPGRTPAGPTAPGRRPAP